MLPHCLFDSAMPPTVPDSCIGSPAGVHGAQTTKTMMALDFAPFFQVIDDKHGVLL